MAPPIDGDPLETSGAGLPFSTFSSRRNRVPSGASGASTSLHLPTVVPRHRHLGTGQEALESTVPDRRSGAVGSYDPRLLGLAGHQERTGSARQGSPHHLAVALRQEDERLVEPVRRPGSPRVPPTFGQLVDEAGCGISSGEHVTMILSNGACSGHPWNPSPIFVTTFL
jgi:hypothetical protein